MGTPRPKTKTYQKLPPEVLRWLVQYECWLVGSGVDWFLGKLKEPPPDFDIVVPPKNWQAVTSTLFGHHVRLTRFGGLHISQMAGTCGGVAGPRFHVDIWPQHLEDFFSNPKLTTKSRQALRIHPYTMLVKEK